METNSPFWMIRGPALFLTLSSRQCDTHFECVCVSHVTIVAGVIAQRRFRIRILLGNAFEVSPGIILHPTCSFFPPWDIKLTRRSVSSPPSLFFFSLLTNLETDKRTIRWAMVCGGDGRRDSAARASDRAYSLIVVGGHTSGWPWNLLLGRLKGEDVTRVWLSCVD